MAKAKPRATAMARAHIQRGFEQRDFMRTGTISYTDWATTRKLSFADRRQIATVLILTEKLRAKGFHEHRHDFRCRLRCQDYIC